MSRPLADIARIIDADVSAEDGTREIRGVAAIDLAGPEDITFISNPQYARFLAGTNAGAVIVARGTAAPSSTVALAVEDPYVAFLKVLELFDTRTPFDVNEGVHPQAFVHPGAKLGKGVSLGACAVLGDGVSVGDNTIIGPGCVILHGTKIGRSCRLYPNVTIMDGCLIGDRVILHAGVVVGSDGFGFAPHGGALHKIPQIGIVRIEDDVEIGAGTCIDRATFGETVVGRGAKIDNLVQLAHNVRIGSSTVIAAQTGISGSTSVGSGVKMGGQSGAAGHIVIGDGASVGGQAGVTKDVPPGEIVSGYPAKKHAIALRQEAALRNIPEMIKKVRDQEKRIAALERLLKERSR